MKIPPWSPLLLLFPASLLYASNPKPVQIVNQPIQTTIEQPVVTTIEEPVLTRPSNAQINADVQFVFSTGVINAGGALLYTVPGDARLVIETVSFWTFTTSCPFYMTPSISTTAGGESSEFRLKVPDRVFFSNDGFYLHNGTWPVKLYADPGSNVTINAFRSDGGCSTTVRASIAGYLEEID